MNSHSLVVFSAVSRDLPGTYTGPGKCCKSVTMTLNFFYYNFFIIYDIFISTYILIKD